MRKTVLFLALTVLCTLPVNADGLPTASSDGNDVWYLIQFMNGGNALTAETDGAQISTGTAAGNDAQLWKFTGNNNDGYTITNKKGYTLYAQSAQKNQMISAATSPSGTTKFTLDVTGNTSYAGGYEIHPMSNSEISMNLWGGPSENRGVGLWDKNDPNNVVRFVSAASIEAMNKIPIIPYPSQLEVTKEGRFAIGSLTAITYPDDETKEHANDFATLLEGASGIRLDVNGSVTENGCEIRLTTDSNLPAEAYTLTVNDNGIDITASEMSGFFYALQTLKQMLPRDIFGTTQNRDADWSVPFVAITDRPALGHRGFMLDIARHFFDKREVKRVLDIMALYKLNRLHWHLTDDQGWRIEIPEYPLLTEVGAIRSGSFSNPGEGTKFFDDTEYGRGMWYSQDDLREIVEYARKRNIEIMPEVDLPGHMVAAITAYPQFSCDSTKSYSVRLDSGISQDVLNIGDDRVIEFLKCVLDNVAGIFPYPYIHIGGDECPTTQWATNAACLQRVQDEGLSGVEQLQSWLVEELGTYLKEKHGKDIVVWDELLSHWNDGNSTKPVIMAWNSINKSREAAGRGFKSIVSPYSELYLDFMQVPVGQTIIDEPYYGGWSDSHVNTIEEVYGINPLSALSGMEDYCMGVQGNMWTETCNDDMELEYQMLPRLLALSETGWLPASQKSWASFYKRLQSHDEILDALGYTYAKHYIEQSQPTAEEQNIADAREILEVSTRGGVGFPDATVYDALHDALSAATAGNDNAATTLADALEAFRTADIVQPQVGRTYKIISASTYYKKQFAGSTMYVSGDDVRFHYTPQTEPEELWQFETAENGYIMRSLLDGRTLKMPAYNSAVKMTDNDATAVRIDKATVSAGGYSYIPGTVTISAVSGYKATATGSIKRLNAELSGYIYANNEPSLCYPGTWYIVEVSDFTAQLQGLCHKCEILLLTSNPGTPGSYTQDALDYLTDNVLTPASAAAAEGDVTESTYNAYVALYNQFLLMPRTGIMDTIKEDCYYYIRNAYFTDYYATYSSNRRVVPRKKGTTDAYLWSVRKNDDGTVRLYNKQTGTAAYISSDTQDRPVMVGSDYNWRLEEISVDTGHSGIGIIDGSGNYSWYTNPDAFTYILTKPYWGACVWSFEESGVMVETAIEEISRKNDTDGAVYDLMGRKVINPTGGIYITGDGHKILKK